MSGTRKNWLEKKVNFLGALTLSSSSIYVWKIEHSLVHVHTSVQWLRKKKCKIKWKSSKSVSKYGKKVKNSERKQWNSDSTCAKYRISSAKEPQSQHFNKSINQKQILTTCPSFDHLFFRVFISGMIKRVLKLYKNPSFWTSKVHYVKNVNSKHSLLHLPLNIYNIYSHETVCVCDRPSSSLKNSREYTQKSQFYI